MESIISLIKARRSCRKFNNQLPTADQVKTLEKAALLAPTSKNNRPWHFIFITDTKTIDLLSGVKPHGATFLKHAPLAIVIIADPEKSDVWIEDTAIAACYLQLTAEDIGLGSCWIQIRQRMYDDQTSASDKIKQLLQVPSTFEVTSIIAIGTKEKERSAYTDEDLLIERIHNNSFQF